MAIEKTKMAYSPPVIQTVVLQQPSAQLICVTGAGPDENGCFQNEEWCPPAGRCITCGDPCSEV